MLYVIIAEDIPDSAAKRSAVRSVHMARMTQMQDSGKLVISGPCLASDHPDPATAGIYGSVIIAEFESLPSARAWAEADPYVKAGVWSKVEVRPFHKGFPR